MNISTENKTKILLIFIALSALIIIFISLLNEKDSAYRRDYWSENCTAGEYAVYSGENYDCEPPKPCVSNENCGYLEISKLPPRTGKCEEGICKAECGSGVIWSC